MLDKMYKINKNSPLPLYYQLKELLIGLIKEGELKPGDKIPSERELCEYHEISRMTVNKALEQLVQEDYLYREKGKGTFVAERKESKVFSPLASFTAEMKAQGLTASTKIRDWEIVEAGEELARQLKLAPGERVYRIERLRLIEGTPFLLEKTYLPVKLCPGLKEEMLSDQSLYRILRERYHYRLERAEATVEPVLISGGTAAVLNVAEGIMGLLFYQLTFLEGGKPVEYTRAFYRSDDYKFKMNFFYEQSN